MHDKHSDAPLKQIPAGVWVLGFASKLMDISSEVIHSLLPMFIGHRPAPWVQAPSWSACLAPTFHREVK